MVDRLFGGLVARRPDLRRAARVLGVATVLGLALFLHTPSPAQGPAAPEPWLDQAYGSDRAQVYDVYRPAGAQAAPVIFMVHGGAWAFGDKAMSRVVDNKRARWLPRGLVLVSVNHRLLPQAGPAEQLQDLAQALAHAQAHAPRWGADPDRFVLMGHSAGAHLVSLLAARLPTLAPTARPVLGTVVLDSAALDLEALMQRPHLPLYDRAFGQDPADWRSLSPLAALRAGQAPMLLVCASGRRDACAHADRYARQAARLGVDVTTLRQDLSHGEINAQLGLAGAYTNAVEDFLARLDPRLAQRLSHPR